MRCGFGSIRRVLDDERALDDTAVRGVDLQTKAPQCCCANKLRSARSRVSFMGTIVCSILRFCCSCDVESSVGVDAEASSKQQGSTMVGMK